MNTRTYVKETFQILWWCHCGLRENLGMEHRHCPGCGAAQEPSHRYFPEPGKRTPTASRGSGPDVVCLYCSSANDRTNAHCCNCGAALGGAKSVHVRPSIPEHAGESPDDAKRDQRAWEQSRREQIKAHHMPAAIRGRERQRAAATSPAQTVGTRSELAIM